MKKHQSTIGKNDEWLTPPNIIKALGDYGFDLDPCAPVNSPFITARHTYNINDDGLSKTWAGRVWLNPPFNRYEREKWMVKMAEHNNGIMLIPAALETENSYKYVWDKCSGILFLEGRPHFHYVDGKRAKANSGCTICLVAYGRANLDALLLSNLGKVVIQYQ
ncbi:DNA N-6-adenine-methyltransferase [Mucilaginibacter sp.]|jgi:hypothetical protein|uniref:DNA N-6-adenine-methyltransferase n=1 Tax=Mucilaginibacter sp. TaxID=1882438 RepID=UPI00356894E6